MHKHITYNELHDPVANYIRGVLYHDKDRYTFTAYRMPYKVLDHQVWKTKQAFNEDYNRLVAKKYEV